MKRRDVLGCIGFVGVCLAIGWLGGLFTMSSIETWYQTLSKPSWNPPGWVFGPVWTVLYIMIGVSGWLVWRTEEPTRGSLTLYAVQLALNAAWSGVFFGLRRPDLAFVEIVLLWVSIVATMLAFRRHSRLAAGLMLPYLAWVTFAAVLNATIWSLS